MKFFSPIFHLPCIKCGDVQTDDEKFIYLSLRDEFKALSNIEDAVFWEST